MTSEHLHQIRLRCLGFLDSAFVISNLPLIGVCLQGRGGAKEGSSLTGQSIFVPEYLLLATRTISSASSCQRAQKIHTFNVKPSNQRASRVIPLIKMRPYIFDGYFNAKRVKTLPPRPTPNPTAVLILTMFHRSARASSSKSRLTRDGWKRRWLFQPVDPSWDRWF